MPCTTSGLPLAQRSLGKVKEAVENWRRRRMLQEDSCLPRATSRRSCPEADCLIYASWARGRKHEWPRRLSGEARSRWNAEARELYALLGETSSP